MLPSSHLVEERRMGSFDAMELTHLIDDGPEHTENRHEIENILIQKTEGLKPEELYSMTHEEIYNKGIEFETNLIEALKDIDLPGQLPGNTEYIRSPYLYSISNPIQNPMIVHSFMFIPTILGQGTEEQQRNWVEKAKHHKIIGTYCQTELGHGTNMRGLETVATYDPQNEEFIINCPNLTSIKCWAGGLGRTANFAIVVAQLHTQDHCYGIHLFIVQLRNLIDHSPLPGIVIGELGPKMGLHAADNGFVQFNNVRIARDHMLMKYAQVLKDGTYVKAQLPRTGYGTLIMARVAIVLESAFRLAQASVIAIRYSAVRHQGELLPGKPEEKILNYKTQQYKLFPQVATAYALIFAFRSLKLQYIGMLADPNEENTVEVHALSSGLKALSSELATSGVDQCRMACGGLGYLLASALPNLHSYMSASCTYDGENTVMYLQTARYIVKIWRAAQNGYSVSGSAAYLCQVDSIQDNIDSLADLLKVYKRTVARMVSDVTDSLDGLVHSGTPPEIAWNELSVDLVKCAKMHCKYFIIQTLYDFICGMNTTEQLQSVLDQVFELLSLYWIKENSGIFLLYGGATAHMLNHCNTRLRSLLKLLRNNMVTLTDAFDFRDEALQSILGCFDGQVYERTYNYLKNLPSNKVQVHPAYIKHLKNLVQVSSKL